LREAILFLFERKGALFLSSSDDAFLPSFIGGVGCAGIF